MKSILLLIAMATGLAAYSQPAVKELKVSSIFSDHMVLQQQSKADFWGHSVPGQKLTISASWGKQASTNTDANGNWKVKLATPKAGGPYTITIKTSKSSLDIKDVLIGEVWLASGQSNMDISVKGWLPEDTIFNSKQEIAQANYPKIRFLKVPFNTSVKPLDSVNSKWIPASPETVGDFSATAYFYARKLFQELNVPIGILQSSIGGTPAEAWTSNGFLKKTGDFNEKLDALEKLQTANETWFKKWPTQLIPKTDGQWQNISFNDSEAAKPKFDDSKWGKIKLPGRIDKLNQGEFDGAMWFRKEFMVDDLGCDYLLKIDAIDDMDATYINGEKIGGLVGESAPNAPREMDIPVSNLVKGVNVIAIRVIDNGGAGSISGKMAITNHKGVTIPLEGEWKNRLVAEIVNGKFYSYGLNANVSERPDISQLNSNSPSVLFNAMINPLVPYTIKGAIWYQGESNVGRAEQYKRIFPNMINDWRDKWGYNFPFYFVQLAPYLYKADDQKGQSPKLRDAQRLALKTPKTGMAVTLDVGKLNTAHPAFKQQVGDRLARFALANDYGKNLVASGPLYKKVIVSGNQLIVEFESVGSGLLASAKGLSDFEIAGADKVFVNAEAKLVDNKVVVSSPSVAAPLYVRYAWSDGSAASLFNKEGLPASTFTSEN